MTNEDLPLAEIVKRAASAAQSVKDLYSGDTANQIALNVALQVAIDFNKETVSTTTYKNASCAAADLLEPIINVRDDESFHAARAVQFAARTTKEAIMSILLDGHTTKWRGVEIDASSSFKKTALRFLESTEEHAAIASGKLHNA